MKKAHYYVPGSNNADQVMIRRETECGMITDLSITAKKAFTACFLHDEMVNTLRKSYEFFDEGYHLKLRIAAILAAVDGKCRDCKAAPTTNKYDRCETCQKDRDEYYNERMKMEHPRRQS